jgi:EAL domain-containing protein (putative c-di-GMP-specific phosphodiesterase class I)/CheY-like chemotaxis protein
MQENAMDLKAEITTGERTVTSIRSSESARRILMVDDEDSVRMALARALRGASYDVTAVASVQEAKAQLSSNSFDLVISDLHMPIEGGLELLQSIRETEPELPVILITGAPTTESAVGALQLKATGYFTKPIDPPRLLAEITRVLKMRELADVRRHAHEITRKDSAELEELSRQLESALDQLFMVFHPVVVWPGREVFGYEALMRTKEKALGNPQLLLDAAQKLGRLNDLGRTVRTRCAIAAKESPDGVPLLVNLHPLDLADPEMYSSSSPLAQVASRIVLEITERAQLETVPDVEKRIASLRAMGFRVAIDDIGAGYSGLNSFALLRPDFVKIDMALVRGIDADPVKRRLTTLLVQLCADLSIGVIAEGVETKAERDALSEIGCDLLQGYLFAKPSTPFPTPNWE